MKHPSISEIRDSHAWKREYERYLPISRFLFRPLGFWVTWIAIRANLTSEAVSWLSGVVGLAGCLLLVIGQAHYLPAGIGLLFLFNLLDCVDGSIARTMKTENPYGRFLDSICGSVVDLVFWGVIGLMAFHHRALILWPDGFGHGNLFWMFLGLTTSYLFIYLGYIERTFDELLRPYWERIEAHDGTVDVDSDAASRSATNSRQSIMLWLRIINNNLRVRETHYVLLLCAFYLHTVDLLLFFYFWYYLAVDIALVVTYSRRGRRIKQHFSANGRKHEQAATEGS